MNKLAQCVIDRVENGIIVIDKDFKILMWNKWLESYSKISVNSVIGHSVTEILPLFKKKYYHQIFQNAFEKGQSMFCSGAIHSMFVQKHGSSNESDSVRQNMRIEPIEYEDQTVLLLQINDISIQHKQVSMLKNEIAERKRIEQAIRNSEEEMKRLKDEALQASKAKTEFLAVMSHEIRTPMNAILGMAELLQETELTEEQRDYVYIFRKSGENLLRIINDILDISKIESGKTEFMRKEIQLPHLISEIVSTYSFQAKKKGLDFTYDTFEDSLFVYGDSTRLHQVISNVISNAVKFTETGFVHIKTKAIDLNDKIKLQCIVSDSGIGIPKNKRDSIFDYFTQVDSSTTRKFGGTGLGLAIVKKLVEKMNGTIEVDGDENGSTFTISVLLDKVEDQETCEKQLKLKSINQEKLIGNIKLDGIKLLVAEDSPDNYKLIKAFLKHQNVTIDIVENGNEAIRSFKENKYDLLLMDIEMPEMDGLEATRQIRIWEKENQLKETPILALTAHALDGYKSQTLDAGCNDHLVKPINKQSLLVSIFKAINNQ